MTDNNLAFSIWQLLTNEENQKHEFKTDFKQSLCTHYAKNGKHSNCLNSTAQLKEACLLLIYAINTTNRLHLYNTKTYNTGITMCHYYINARK